MDSPVNLNEQINKLLDKKNHKLEQVFIINARPINASILVHRNNNCRVKKYLYLKVCLATMAIIFIAWPSIKWISKILRLHASREEFQLWYRSKLIFPLEFHVYHEFIMTLLKWKMQLTWASLVICNSYECNIWILIRFKIINYNWNMFLQIINEFNFELKHISDYFKCAFE